MTAVRLRILLRELDRMYTASEERIACLMAALTCGALREAFLGLVYADSALREARCWS